MGKLDPNLALILIAGIGGAIVYFKLGGREALANLNLGGGATNTDKVPPNADVPPAKDAPKEDSTPEPEAPDVEERWNDDKGNVYIIKIDGWMWYNGRRMYPPDHEMWARWYRMRKYHWRHKSCKGKYRNSRWCKDKHRWCVGAWKHTPWCKGFQRGGDYWDDRDNDNPQPPWDREKCPWYIFKNGRKYRFTQDPMPDIMPAIFPPPYVKEGSCVYKLDNNQGSGQNQRDGWDGDRGGPSGQDNWWDKIGDMISGKTSFYTYNRIGNI